MKHLLIGLCAAIINIASAIAAPIKANIPQADFAYPQKVSAQAQKDLDKALKADNANATVNALIRLGLAQGAISADKLPAVIERIDDIANRQRDSITRSLLYTLLADIYSEIYFDRRYIYDSRQLPLLPLPDDIFAWSGEQFKTKISEALTAAVEPAETLKSAKITDFATIIAIDDNTSTFYPTLFDFVANKAIDTRKQLNNNAFTMAQRWLCSAGEFVKRQTGALPDELRSIVGLYQELLGMHAPLSAPAVLTDLNRYDFVMAHLPSSDSGATSATELYLNLFSRNSDSDFAGLILGKAYNDWIPFDDKCKVYAAISAYLEAHPTAFDRAWLTSLANRATTPKIEITTPPIISKRQAATIKIAANNIKKCRLNIYKVDAPTSNDLGWNPINKASAQLIETKTLEWDKPVPCATDTTLSIALPDYGVYALLPEADGLAFTDERINTFRCSDMALAALTSYGFSQALVLDPLSGRPVDNAEVMLYGNTTTSLGVTDSDGCLQLPDVNNNRRNSVSPVKGDDRFSPIVNVWEANAPSAKVQMKILTDLPLYHPGDTVSAVAILYDRRADGNNPRQGEPIILELRDANFNIVDKANATTDSQGRVTARLAIPDNGLSGQFRIQALDKRLTRIATTSVTVSDYRLPTFEISTEKISVKPGCPVDISGAAATYAGFPLSDTRISLTLCNASPWRWWSQRDNSPAFYTVETLTDGNGKFHFTLPLDILENSPQPEALFVAKITAVSPSGESQNATEVFSLVKNYRLSVAMPEVINADTPATIDIEILGSDNIAARYDVIASLDSNGVNLGRLDIGNDGKAAFANVPSGSYTVTFALADTSLNCHQITKDIIVYRSTDKVSPVDKPLWVPSQTITADGSTRKARISYAVADDSTAVYYLATGRDGVVAKGWLHPSKGFNSLEISVPDGQTQLSVNLLAARNLQLVNESVAIETPESLRSLAISLETFRDKVTPGGSETLTLSVTDNSGNPVKAALILDIYNKALTQLADPRFSFSTQPLFTPFNSINSRLNGAVRTFFEKNAGHVDSPAIGSPEFQLYDRRFIPYTIAFGTRRSPMLMTKSMDNATETADEDSTADDGTAAPVPEQQFAYRNSATPLALFSPELSTDADGKLKITYKMPLDNATWTLAAIAYDDMMLTTGISRDIIASKPIMVQPNCPRFLRTGDSAVVLANVMNATDSIVVASTEFVIFDPSNGRKIAATTSTDTIAPRQSAVASLSIDTPFDAAMLGYRIKSATTTHADGEQGIIPVLPSAQPVIATKPFYIAADSTLFEMQLPKTSAGSRITLSFCENPTWYVVTALPGLRSGDMRTSNAAAAAIFSAAVAEGIIRDNPEINSALHRWFASDRSDSAITSMLEQNSDLKISLLQATPWMLDAQNDSLRISRLALLFDKKEIATTYIDNINTLATAQRPSGGWAWTSDFGDASYWVTSNILEGFGLLNRLGYRPADKRLDEMIATAVRYLDKETVSRFKKNPDADFTHYAYIRDLFPEIKQSTAAAKITESTIQRLISQWNGLNIIDKAIAVLILHNHAYDATARNIIASLDEFAHTSSEKGMWWPSLDAISSSRYSKIGAAATILDAYAAIYPSSKAVDSIRQWILLQKESQDWGDAVTTSQVIASFLSTGSKWTAPAHGATITVNGNEVTPRSIEKFTGYFRDDITSLAAGGGSLSIVTPGNHPSWGAVFTQTRPAMSRIKASACQSLSIEKSLFRAVNSPSGTSWVETDTFTVGDRLKVDLLIKADTDLDYVVIVDQRAACLQPVEQLPRPVISQGVYFYRENRDAATNIFIDRLPRGVYRLSYQLFVNNAGRFSAGAASIQSQYSPSISANSAGAIINVNRLND